MKRTAALLLPLILCALVWGVKWRADHPTPTKSDLELRALISSSSQRDLLYSRYKKKSYRAVLSKEDVELLATSFNLSPSLDAPSYVMMGKRGIIYISFSFSKPTKDGFEGANVYLPLDQGNGKIDFPNKAGTAPQERKLHPVTVKRWIEFLLENPRVGPELRARMNPMRAD